ncbi:MarR family transcriptional regulator [Leptospira perolatii]|uniref:MarR family transcriptional regulator n=1 Tax=Leptospira perolatii TaxID=2023191 RepID=A0A2M9ZNN6_9LEPT|nr:MarR family transcriptional regulator [Leptospira perolatii]PJZ69602.1 MarR family transcriptional regulator [Leptospira perolatii]PJZ73589.1 MarR family transcriptional regulator [Leptospira perolatii]
MSKEKVFSFKNADDSPGFLLWQVSNLWQREIRKVLEPFELTHAQFVLLAVSFWLKTVGMEATQVRIAERAKTDPMTTSTVLRTLEKKKLIRRFDHSTDTRAKLVEVTEKGEALLHEVVPGVEGFDSRFFAQVKGNKKDFTFALKNLLGKSE